MDHCASKSIVLRNRSRAKRAAAVAIASTAVFWAGGACAQAHPMDAEWFLRAGVFLPSVDTKLRADATDGRVGTTVHFESDLGMDDSRSLPNLDLAWRFSPRHQVGLGYFKLDRSATKTISRSIDFEDETYPVNARVRGEFDSTFVVLSYLYSFYRTPDAEIAAGAGLHHTTLKAALSIDDDTLGFTARDAAASAPLPVIALRAAMKFSDSVGGDLRYQWFGLKYGDYEGRLDVVNVAVNYFPWRNVGIELGYHYSRYDLKVSRESWRGEGKYQFSGPVLSLLATF